MKVYQTQQKENNIKQISTNIYTEVIQKIGSTKFNKCITKKILMIFYEDFLDKYLALKRRDNYKVKAEEEFKKIYNNNLLILSVKHMQGDALEIKRQNFVKHIILMPKKDKELFEEISEETSSCRIGLKLSDMIYKFFMMGAKNIIDESSSSLSEKIDNQAKLPGFSTIDEYNSTDRLETKYKINESTERGKLVSLFDEDMTHDIYIPDEVLTERHLHTLILKDNNFIPILSPKISLSESYKFHDSVNKVRKLKIFVKNRLTCSPIGEKLVAGYNFDCPACGDKFQLQKNEINSSQYRRHLACPSSDKDGPMVEKNSNTPDAFREVYIYEIDIINTTTGFLNTYYIWSFYSNIEPGEYLADVFSYIGKLNSLDDRANTNMLILLGFERNSDYITTNTFDVVPDISVKWCEEHKLPHLKIFDIMLSLRKMYKEHYGVIIGDTGALLQLVTLITNLLILTMDYRHAHISITGTSDISKTFSMEAFSKAMTLKMAEVDNIDNSSLVGLLGGQSDNINVNGTMTKMHKSGLATTATFVMMEESESMYSDSDRNKMLKNIDKPTVSRYFSGSVIKPQNWTLGIVANIPSTHLAKMRKLIKENYLRLLKGYFTDRTPEEASWGTSENFLKSKVEDIFESIDMFLPIGYIYRIYGSKILCRAINLARVILGEYNRKDWRTSGEYASSARILFDFHVNDIKETESVEDSADKGTMFDLPDRLPVLEIANKIKDFLDPEGLLESDDGKHSYTDAYRDRLNSIEDSIKNFFKNDARGRDIIMFLRSQKSEEKRMSLYNHGKIKSNKSTDNKLDKKLRSIMARLQLLENPRSTCLDNANKELTHILVSMIKRGLTCEEYNLNNINRDYEDFKFDDISLSEVKKINELQLDDDRLKRDAAKTIRAVEMKEEDDRDKELAAKLQESFTAGDTK